MRPHTPPSWQRTLIRVCVLYTAVTLLSSGLGLAAGRSTDTHVHLFLRLGFVVVGVAAFDLYDLLRRRYGRAPAWLLGATTYAVAVTVVMAGMWLWGAAGGDLHPDAFRDGFLNFTAVGLALGGIAALVERTRAHAHPR